MRSLFESRDYAKALREVMAAADEVNTYFDQAARSVACVAEILRRAGREPEAMEAVAEVAEVAEVEAGSVGASAPRAFDASPIR